MDPPGTWEVSSSPHENFGMWSARSRKRPGPGRIECSEPGRDEAGTRRGVLATEGKPKVAGRGVEKSERPDSTGEAGERFPPDPVEGSGAPSHGSLKGKAAEMPDSGEVSTRLRRIAELAEEAPDRAFNSLNHHLDLEWLREAYRRTRKDGAPGVDGRTAEEYGANLEANLRDLLERAKSGRYRAPPVRRVHIPKGKGRGTRPLGVPTFEDKVLQRAVLMILEPVYEPLFKDFSYGFRPRRSAHQAIERIWKEGMEIWGGWIVELDIQSYFDTIPHAELQSILRKRVRDGVLLRLIGKWLNAGVMEEGRVHRPTAGSPQGGVISPLLSNVYLHEVLDSWFDEAVRPRLNGRGFLVRFADDAVMGFSSREDARRVMNVLPKRFGKFGLVLHPEKTRLVYFRPTRKERGGGKGKGKGPGTFDFLGFTHYWGRARSGRYVIRRRTAKDRFSRSKQAFNEHCRKTRHLTIRDQHRMLSAKLRGHYAYFGISGNGVSLGALWNEVRRVWRKWLNRRSQRRTMTWKRFLALIGRHPLPPPRILHRYAT